MLIYCACGKRLGKPVKKLENPTFIIEVYKCKKCKATYKDAHYQFVNWEMPASINA